MNMRNTTTLRLFVGVSRLPFLLLTVALVQLAWTLVDRQGVTVSLLPLWLVFVGATAAHVAVNALNEYADFKSGLDLETTRTPFSGGSGTLPATPNGARLAKYFAFAALAICVVCGLLLTRFAGWPLVLPGVVGIVLILLYTSLISHFPWLCLIAPGVGFGLLMLPGAVIALDGQLDPAVWISSAIVFCLTNNLLLLNQLPDAQADKKHGRRTIPIVYGTNFSLWIAGVFYTAALILVFVATFTGVYPYTSYMALLFAPFAVISLVKLQSGLTPEQMSSGLALNVVVVVGFPLMMSALWQVP